MSDFRVFALISTTQRPTTPHDVKTATSDESALPLLVHNRDSIFDSDDEIVLDFDEERGFNMTSAVEASQETYYKSDDASNQEIQNNDGHAASGVEGGPYEMRNTGDENPEHLDEVLEAIEGKKKVWYAYLTTWDFWIVVILGCAHPILTGKTHRTNCSMKQTNIGALQYGD